MEIINNKDKTLIDDLRSTLTKGSRMSIVASCFSIYAYQELRKELEQIEELRFIFNSPTFTTEKSNKEQREFYIPRLNRERSLTGSEFEIQLRNELTQKAIAKECADWIRRKVQFKSNRTKENMMGFGVVDSTSYMPLNGFTTVDLGVESGNEAYTMIQKAEAPVSVSYAQIFEELWQDEAGRLQDVTNEVVESISSVYKENPPELIYFITIFNLFREFLEDVSEDVLPNEHTGFKETAVWQKLYNFQKDAALGIINKLEKYNGCILADSVGLGKTFTAISVIKYYELRNKSVLVLCPKKLYQNWSTYRNNYKNNPLHSDRLRYDVLYHTDLGRVSGENNGIDLGKINWGNYDLVVIDESHNFRNGGKISSEDDDLNPRKNRYLRLLDDVIKKGVKTKVLMLSATPVNNRFSDLKNQLQLACEGNKESFCRKLNIEGSFDDIFKKAQKAYNDWSYLPEEDRTTEALLDALRLDFFEVLDSVTIARSRRHIEQYYDTAEVGAFPKRLPVLSHRPQLTSDTDIIDYSNLYKKLEKLNLAIYTPSDFIQPSKRDKYFDDESDEGRCGFRSGREQGIRRLMCTNMLKRLESSVASFRLTLQRLNESITATIKKIELFENNKKATVVQPDFEEGLDIDDSNDELLIGGGKTTIDLRDMDHISWKAAIEQDKEMLQSLLKDVSQITPDKDAKLQHLLNTIEQKITHPINTGNKKVIVFTAFADTAEYLYEHLSAKIQAQHGLHSVLITGGVDARSTLKLSAPNTMNFDTALTLFSPCSKDKEALLPNVSEEIDLLIATDCISEGQNLQDCDYLINYDIHWNPVRLIQRFGRIDRIGSSNSCIQMVNYWPDLQLDEYIKLKARVENRMKASVMVSTGDDNLLSNDEKGDLEYRRKQLTRLQTEVVDLEEMSTGVSILDLGLNDFRLDLLDYTKKHGALENTPLGLHAVVPSDDKMPPGVIYILKNLNQGRNIDRKNQLHPFYMVYLTQKGEVHCDHLSPKRILDLMRWSCRGKSSPLMDSCKLFNKETKDGSKMDSYSKLLRQAVESIISVKSKQEIDSLFSEGVTTALEHKIKGLGDFELIAFLVVK